MGTRIFYQWNSSGQRSLRSDSEDGFHVNLYSCIPYKFPFRRHHRNRKDSGMSYTPDAKKILMALGYKSHKKTGDSIAPFYLCKKGTSAKECTFWIDEILAWNSLPLDANLCESEVKAWYDNLTGSNQRDFDSILSKLAPAWGIRGLAGMWFALTSELIFQAMELFLDPGTTH